MGEPLHPGACDDCQTIAQSAIEQVAKPAKGYGMPNSARASWAFRLSLAGLALVIAFALPLADAAVAAKGNCKAPNIAFKTRNKSSSTTATGFVRLPGTKVDFTQGGSTRSCVVVQFSGRADTAHTLVIRARIGDKVASPSLVGLSTDTAGQGAHAFTFVFPKIDPGKHKVVIEWHGFYGEVANMHQRTTTVYHR
jgi:hypothetical protein